MVERTIDDIITDTGNVDIGELRSRAHDIEDFYVHGIDGGSFDDYESAWRQLLADLREIEKKSD